MILLLAINYVMRFLNLITLFGTLKLFSKSTIIRHKLIANQSLKHVRAHTCVPNVSKVISTSLLDQVKQVHVLWHGRILIILLCQHCSCFPWIRLHCQNSERRRKKYKISLQIQLQMVTVISTTLVRTALWYNTFVHDKGLIHQEVRCRQHACSHSSWLPRRLCAVIDMLKVLTLEKLLLCTNGRTSFRLMFGISTDSQKQISAFPVLPALMKLSDTHPVDISKKSFWEMDLR